MCTKQNTWQVLVDLAAVFDLLRAMILRHIVYCFWQVLVDLTAVFNVLRGMIIICNIFFSWQALGRAEWMSGQYSLAREVFEEGHAVAGPSAPLLHVWAQLEMGMGNAPHIKAARELFDRISVLDPTHVPSLQDAAQMEDRAGNVVRSTQGYQAALALDPSNVQVRRAPTRRRRPWVCGWVVTELQSTLAA